jgi:surfeit locus 1 family protein
MARHAGVTDYAPVFVDADATPNPGGLPEGGQTRVNLPNNHLQYALTWFGLALTLIVMFVYAHSRPQEPGPDGSAEARR